MPRRSSPYRPDRSTVVEFAAGGVILSKKERRILLLHEMDENRWCLPKGHLERGERLEEGARREITEETGLHELRLIADLGEVTYRFYRPLSGMNVMKVVVYFLFKTSKTEVRRESLFDRHGWFGFRKAATLVRHQTEREALRRGRRCFYHPAQLIACPGG